MPGNIAEGGRKAQRFLLWRSLGALRRLKLAGPGDYLLAPVAYYRHVQHIREIAERRNPDALAGHFLSVFERRMAVLESLENIRRDPFYHFALARTKFYDAALLKAVDSGFRQIVFVGVGMDTRSFRFRAELDAAGVLVVETDLGRWIEQRVRRCRGLIPPRRFRQVPFDVQSDDLEALARHAGLDVAEEALFIAEGVSPYVSARGWERFLQSVGAGAAAGGRIVYDAKLSVSQPTPRPDAGALFRLPGDPADIDALHAARGLHVGETNRSAEIQKALAPYAAPVFDEDIIVVAEIARRLGEGD